LVCKCYLHGPGFCWWRCFCDDQSETFVSTFSWVWVTDPPL